MLRGDGGVDILLAYDCANPWVTGARIKPLFAIAESLVN